LFVLLSALMLAERGWLLMILAVAVFFVGYFRLAPPFLWERWSVGVLISSLASTVLPFFAIVIIEDVPLRWGRSYVSTLWIAATALYFVRVGAGLLFRRFFQKRPLPA